VFPLNEKPSPSVIQFTLTAIKMSKGIQTGIALEIKEAISKFGEISKIYWPQAFRNLVRSLLEIVLKKSELWSTISMAENVVNEEFLLD
jgi:hypothetical protein